MVQETELTRYGGDQIGGGSGSCDSRFLLKLDFTRTRNDRPGRRFRSLSKVIHAKNPCQGQVRARVLLTDGGVCTVGT